VRRAPGVAVLEEPPARQRHQRRDRTMQARVAHFLRHRLAALGLEAQRHDTVGERHVRLEQCRGAARAVLARILFATGADGGEADQLDDCRRDERLIDRLGLQRLGDGALDVGQRLGEPGEPPRLQRLAHLGPSRVVAILQAPGSIGADRLQVRRRIGGIAHVGIGRRHCQRLQPRDLLRIAQQRASFQAKAEAGAATLPAHRQGLGPDDGEALLARHRLDEFSLGSAHAEKQRCIARRVASRNAGGPARANS
jgi:hypothetical protein